MPRTASWQHAVPYGGFNSVVVKTYQPQVVMLQIEHVWMSQIEQARHSRYFILSQTGASIPSPLSEPHAKTTFDCCGMRLALLTLAWFPSN
jgi:hypothetical protein